jgi:hypothetical protein
MQHLQDCERHFTAVEIGRKIEIDSFSKEVISSTLKMLQDILANHVAQCGTAATELNEWAGKNDQEAIRQSQKICMNYMNVIESLKVVKPPIEY